MRPPSPLPPPLRERPFLVSEALGLGVSAERLRSSDLVAPHRGVRMPVGLSTDRLARCRAALLVMPAGSAICAWSAASLLRLPVPAREDDGSIDVHVPAGAPRPRVRKVRLCGGILDGAPPVVTSRGLPVVDPLWVWVELCAQLDPVDAVVMADVVLARCRDTSAMVCGALQATSPVARDRGLEGAFLARTGVDSPMETRVRLLLREAGVPEPQCGRNAFDEEGGWIARPDLSWPSVKVAVEYDGLHHLDVGQRRRDVGRDRALRAAGWRVIVVVDTDVLVHPASTITMITQALRERGLRW